MPPSNFQNRQATQQLLQGINTMQMQAGLMPGGVPMVAPPPVPTPRVQSASDFARNLQVRFQQQQQLSQMITPPPFQGSMSPVRRPTPFEMGTSFPAPNLPPPRFGSGRMMARQQVAGSINENFAMMQGGAGVAGRAAGGMASFAAGGMLGAAAYEHFGVGQFMQRTGSQVMQPFIDQRTRALQLQGMSQQFVRGGADLSGSGRGLSMGAARQLEGGLREMAGSRQFQQETGGMFNRQDVMKITRLAGDMGMLEQSQTADNIRRDVGKISRALSNFMKVAEEPDVQEAMRQMGQMRQMGMSIPETSMAARNARMFARMAGTDTRTVMAGGMQGAGMFQRAGLSQAAGLQAGMAAQGMAGQLAPLMGARGLAMAGGQQGIAQTFAQGAARSATLDALLPALLTRRNGELTVDREMLSRVASGEMNMQQAMQASARNVQRMGGREFLQEISTRRRELQDQMSSAMGGQGAILMPMIQARMLQQSTPGTSFGAALRTTGMSEQQARTFERAAQDPRFFQNMLRQARQEVRENRSEVSARRRETAEIASTPRWVRESRATVDLYRNRLGRGVTGLISRISGEEDQELEEERAAQGGGRLISVSRRARLETDVQRAGFTDLLHSEEGRRALRAGAVGTARQSRATARMENERGRPLFSGVTGALGLTPAVREGATQRELVESRFNTADRVVNAVTTGRGLGGGPSALVIEQEARRMKVAGIAMERAASRTGEEQETAIEELRQSGGGAGLSEEEFSNAFVTATAAVNEFANDTGFLGMGGGPINPDAMVAHVRSKLLQQGVPPQQVNTMLERGINSPIVQAAIKEGENSRSPEAQDRVNQTIEAGAQEGGREQAQAVSIERERAEGARKSALASMGMTGVGDFFGASEEDQRGVLDAMTGAGATGEVKRLLVAAEAAAAAENTGLAGQLRERARAKAREAGLDVAELTSQVRTSLSSARESGELRRMGKSYEGKDVGTIENQVVAAGGQVQEAAQRMYNEGMTGAVGVVGFEAYSQAGGGEAGLEALRAGVESGDITLTNEDLREKILTGRITAEELENFADTTRSTDTDMTFAGGVSALKEGGLEGIINYISGGQTRGGQGTQQDTPAGPQTFEQAVGTFSHASSQLLKAAEEMSGERSVTGVGAIVSAASPLTGGVLGVISGLFGGGDSPPARPAPTPTRGIYG